MLSVYVPRGTSLERIAIEPGQQAPAAAVWIDLVSPTEADNRSEEDAATEDLVRRSALHPLGIAEAEKEEDGVPAPQRIGAAERSAV